MIVERNTAETRVRVELALTPGTVAVNSGIGFLDHLLAALAFHAGWSLDLVCRGDRTVDDHHSAEDCGLALGQALAGELGTAGGRSRFGSAYAPLDDALARAVVDWSGRPWASVALGLVRPSIGELAAENVSHVLESMAMAGAFCLHVDVLKGRNDHHRAEAAFKAVALAFRDALAPSSVYVSAVPSSKGAVLAGIGPGGGV
ncbi:MAG: imidazoleglycerol-phosphate dehydratase [Spirochaetia bacterium]|nr:imidazoleglycerol-phosphate dehydratase [Spirochaetia bacterium]